MPTSRGRRSRQAKRSKSRRGTASGALQSPRYTPPTRKELRVTPPWVPVLMITSFMLGTGTIFLNYLGVLLPGATSNWYLLVGLGFMLVGLVAATRFH